MISFRRFKSGDAEFCYRVRCDAFIRKFYDKIGPEAVSACINAYMPDDYISMSKKVGFTAKQESVCQFPGMDVKAIRFEKILSS